LPFSLAELSNGDVKHFAPLDEVRVLLFVFRVVEGCGEGGKLGPFASAPRSDDGLNVFEVSAHKFIAGRGDDDMAERERCSFMGSSVD
jgi:hypothetical protein